MVATKKVEFNAGILTINKENRVVKADRRQGKLTMEHVRVVVLTPPRIQTVKK